MDWAKILELGIAFMGGGMGTYLLSLLTYRRKQDNINNNLLNTMTAQHAELKTKIQRIEDSYAKEFESVRAELAEHDTWEREHEAFAQEESKSIADSLISLSRMPEAIDRLETTMREIAAEFKSLDKRQDIIEQNIVQHTEQIFNLKESVVKHEQSHNA